LQKAACRFDEQKYVCHDLSCPVRKPLSNITITTP
jgi:hypothetical protein